METLLVLGAVEKTGDSYSLTSLGQSMSAFPLDPKLAKVLLASKTYRCSEEVLSIVALLSTGEGGAFFGTGLQAARVISGDVMHAAVL